MPTSNRRQKHEEEIIDRTSPPGEIVYEAVHAEGEHELKRSGAELALSGFAAGLSMGFSMVAEALLRVRLPEAPWTPLISKLGYSVGFLIVILGRQQLFTKNTLTVILPLLREKKVGMLRDVARLWALVLATNLFGAFIFAWFAAHSNAFSPEARTVFTSLGQAAVEPGFSAILVRSIVSGWLIALMVWLLPFAETARIWVIIIMAYVVGLADLPHIVAGSVETFYLVTTGALSIWNWVVEFFIPALIGNVIGGVALVAVGAHAEYFEAEKKAS